MGDFFISIRMELEKISHVRNSLGLTGGWSGREAAINFRLVNDSLWTIVENNVFAVVKLQSKEISTQNDEKQYLSQLGIV